MFWAIVLILGGFVLLYYGAEGVVAGAGRLGRDLGIPKAVVGVVLVAFGTSAPELFVNIISAAEGRTSFALANVSGSNLTNLCLGFGLVGLLHAFRLFEGDFGLDLLYFVGAPLILLGIVGIVGGGLLPVWSTAILIPLLILYLRLAMRRFKAGRDRDVATDRVACSRGSACSSVGVWASISAASWWWAMRYGSENRSGSTTR